ncbi:hypothetical protein TNCV_2145941 [Trichonephila clavipes]|uniref:Uncharacterized protein n=1 Tax=Trichonephila clavipes TaxID=2585209 RepID=A0A8X6SUY6_TRICX|nr:hypothetical protein TNCV_2145941 [Trichonephila clavipes]
MCSRFGDAAENRPYRESYACNICRGSNSSSWLNVEFWIDGTSSGVVLVTLPWLKITSFVASRPLVTYSAGVFTKATRLTVSDRDP